MLANICITVSWYLCQAPFSHSAMGAGLFQLLRVGLRSLLHITVSLLCLHGGFVWSASVHWDITPTQHSPALPCQLDPQADCSRKGGMLSYLFAVRLIFPLRGRKAAAFKMPAGAAASQTHSQLLLPVGAVELISQDCWPSHHMMLAAVTQRGSESYSWHPSALGRRGQSLTVLNTPFEGLK